MGWLIRSGRSRSQRSLLGASPRETQSTVAADKKHKAAQRLCCVHGPTQSSGITYTLQITALYICSNFSLPTTFITFFFFGWNVVWHKLYFWNHKYWNTVYTDIVLEKLLRGYFCEAATNGDAFRCRLEKCVQTNLPKSGFNNLKKCDYYLTLSDLY